MVVTFVRLKLRLTVNGLRGRPSRIVMAVFGALFVAWFGLAAFIGFAIPGLLGDARIAGLVLPLGGAAIVVGWLLFPLALFGVDESLDPARFALLPLRRGTLIRGMLAAALVGLPALGTLAATTGMVVSAARLAGAGAGLVEVAGVLLGLLLCVAASRAVTSAFAGGLRSRRGRDAASVLLAMVAALLGPIQILARAGAERADWQRVAAVARVVEWTPFGAPYAMGTDVIAGRAWGVAIKLAVVLTTIAGLLWWWSRTLERAMFDASSSGPASRAGKGDPVTQLVLPFLPRTRSGALISREARYWWRESRRRASLITFSVVGIFVPVMLSATGGGAPNVLPFVGALAAVGLANQFGFDGSGYAANIVAGVPGRAEVHSRVAGYSLYAVPVLAAAGVVLGFVAGRPAAIPALLGSLAAAYGVGLAVVLPISVVGAYAMPDSTNPFATTSGAGSARALIGLAALAGAAVGTAPVLLLSYLMHDAWLFAGPPIGLAYGTGAYLVGSRIAGRALDRRMPELLAAVTPRR